MKEFLKKLFVPSEQSDGVIFFSLIFLSILGLCTVGSASMGTTVGNLWGLVMVIVKQAFFLVVGYVAMNLCSKKFTTESVHSEYFLILAGGIGPGNKPKKEKEYIDWDQITEKYYTPF